MTSIELAVDRINLALDNWMPDWLIQYRAMEEETALRHDYRDDALRAICLRAREAEEVIKAEHGAYDCDYGLHSHIIKYAFFVFKFFALQPLNTSFNH
ncbi:MAG: hypothetical protein JW923_05385 [Spirochaetales bacterium]|nr:hypothetical protein [Spirochaetales bacterium]